MARVAEAEADIRFYEREDRRERALLARNATTPENFDANLRSLESARARRSAAVASCDRFDALIAKTRITAPIDGVVTARHAHPGEIARPGTALVTIADLKRLRIEAEVDEFDTARVALGSPVTITAEGYGATKWRGTVEEIPDSVVSRRSPADRPRASDRRPHPADQDRLRGADSPQARPAQSTWKSRLRTPTSADSAWLAKTSCDTTTMGFGTSGMSFESGSETGSVAVSPPSSSDAGSSLIPTFSQRPGARGR